MARNYWGVPATPNILDEIFSLLNKGLSYSEVAKLTGKTRNSIAGLINRNREYYDYEPRNTHETFSAAARYTNRMRKLNNRMRRLA